MILYVYIVQSLKIALVSGPVFYQRYLLLYCCYYVCFCRTFPHLCSPDKYRSCSGVCAITDPQRHYSIQWQTYNTELLIKQRGRVVCEVVYSLGKGGVRGYTQGESSMHTHTLYTLKVKLTAHPRHIAPLANVPNVRVQLNWGGWGREHMPLCDWSVVQLHKTGQK